MNTKSSIKQRREQRIKALQMQGMPLMTEEKNTSSMNNSADSKRVRALPMQEPDPEKAWKSNPDRWSDWRDGNDRRDHYSFFKDFRIKMLLSMVLFSALWLLFQFDHKWTLAGQTYVRQAMTEEMDFDAAAAWYKQHFAGAPSFIPIFEQSGGEAVGVDGELRLPVVAPLSDGLVIRTFAELLNGVELAGKGAQEVVAAERDFDAFDADDD